MAIKVAELWWKRANGKTLQFNDMIQIIPNVHASLDRSSGTVSESYRNRINLSSGGTNFDEISSGLFSQESFDRKCFEIDVQPSNSKSIDTKRYILKCGNAMEINELTDAIE